MDTNNIDENKLREAKEKLACKIEPPKKVTNECGSSSCAVGASSEQVKLTQMTTAGG